MKILFVDNAGLVGGAEEHLMDLSAWLTGNGVETVFVAREEGFFREALTRRGFAHHPSSREWPRKALSLLQLARAIIREKPDVLSVNREHDLLPAYVALGMARPFLPRLPRTVAVFHTPTGRRHDVLARYDGIVCTSRFTADAFIRANRSIRNRVAVIRYGIRIPDVDPEPKLRRDRSRKFFSDRGFPIIGMVGELWKNQEELVEVARPIVREFPGLTVAVVGGGYPSQFESLREKIRLAGLERNFVLTGRQGRERIPDIFHDFDLSVSTHRNEGFGIVHIESLACLTPVVAYNTGGYVEMLREGGGILVDGGAGELASAVVGLLGDDGRREALAREGRRIVEEKFSVSRMGEDHLGYYRAIAGGGKG
ncbi:MAG: glycosyltransferase family 4 protein [Deltaproteobacteria bacterium]